MEQRTADLDWLTDSAVVELLTTGSWMTTEMKPTNCVAVQQWTQCKAVWMEHHSLAAPDVVPANWWELVDLYDTHISRAHAAQDGLKLRWTGRWWANSLKCEVEDLKKRLSIARSRFEERWKLSHRGWRLWSVFNGQRRLQQATGILESAEESVRRRRVDYIDRRRKRQKRRKLKDVKNYR